MARGWNQIFAAVARMGGADLRRQKLAGTGSPEWGSEKVRVSKYQPHQNTRQLQRYARQVAAGQLNMEISP